MSTVTGQPAPRRRDRARPGRHPHVQRAENIELIAGRVRAAVPGRRLLVADDNSPDGTGEVADELAAADTTIHVLHRAGKAGPGRRLRRRVRLGARPRLRRRGRDGRRRLARPEQLPRLLAALRERRPGARLPLGPRRQSGQLARHRAALSPAAATSTSAWPSGMPCATPPAVSAPTAAGAEKLDFERSAPRATASRSTWPGEPAGGLAGGRGADHLRRTRARPAR